MSQRNVRGAADDENQGGSLDEHAAGSTQHADGAVCGQ